MSDADKQVENAYRFYVETLARFRARQRKIILHIPEHLRRDGVARRPTELDIIAAEQALRDACGEPAWADDGGDWIKLGVGADANVLLELADHTVEKTLA